MLTIAMLRRHGRSTTDVTCAAAIVLLLCCCAACILRRRSLRTATTSCDLSARPPASHHSNKSAAAMHKRLAQSPGARSSGPLSPTQRVDELFTSPASDLKRGQPSSAECAADADATAAAADGLLSTSFDCRLPAQHGGALEGADTSAAGMVATAPDVRGLVHSDASDSSSELSSSLSGDDSEALGRQRGQSAAQEQMFESGEVTARLHKFDVIVRGSYGTVYRGAAAASTPHAHQQARGPSVRWISVLAPSALCTARVVRACKRAAL